MARQNEKGPISCGGRARYGRDGYGLASKSRADAVFDVRETSCAFRVVFLKTIPEYEASQIALRVAVNQKHSMGLGEFPADVVHRRGLTHAAFVVEED